MLRLIGRRLVPAVAALVALVLAHDLAFLARYGSAYGEALAHVGHGPAWTGAVVGSLVLGTGLLAVALARLGRLRRLAVQLAARPMEDEPGVRDFLRAWSAASARLAVATGVLLTIQENVERAAIGLPSPDLGLLASHDYPMAPAIVAAVAVAVAFVLALIGWRHVVLEARIRRARLRPWRAASAPHAVVATERRPATPIGGRLAVRAPPTMTVHASPA